MSDKINAENLEALGFVCERPKTWMRYSYTGENTTLIVSVWNRGKLPQITIMQNGQEVTANFCRSMDDLKTLYLWLEGEPLGQITN